MSDKHENKNEKDKHRGMSWHFPQIYVLPFFSKEMQYYHEMNGLHKVDPGKKSQLYKGYMPIIWFDILYSNPLSVTRESFLFSI